MKQDIVMPTSMLIDPSIEPLQVILPLYTGITHVPSDLRGPALFVFKLLHKCFERAGKVCEGLLPNLIWGFQECGHDPQHVAAGMTELRRLGYVFYSDAGRLPISELTYTPNKHIQIWVRYEKKMLDLCMKDGRPGINLDEKT